jgi:alpha-tubulin suppressor-like RCC1 family protein
VQALTCEADVRANLVSCASGADVPDDGLSRIILNPPVQVSLASSNFSFAGGLYTFDVTVQNHYRQTLGVATSGLPDGAGVRVFFTQLPVATQGTGTITVNGAETGKLTRGGQLFYRYNQTLATGQISRPRQWSFSVPETVIRFTFSVLVAASVQHPRGWVEIRGAPTVRVARNGTYALAAVVRDDLGRDITASADSVVWSLADSSVATISGTSLTGAASTGYTTLTATAGARSAQVLLLVGTPFVRLAAGRAHTCGLTPDGQAYCWGENESGQLGDSTTTDRLTATAVRQGASRYVQITARGEHTCALTAAGQAFCWGRTTFVPVAVAQGSTTFAGISAGAEHTCGLTDAGRAWCWGWNGDGQLGDSTFTPRSTPVAVLQGIPTYLEIAAGGEYTCARAAGGHAWCWGNGQYGRLGDGGRRIRPIPGEVRQGAFRYVDVASGGVHGCGLSADGQTRCWGWNGYGQIGDGSFMPPEKTVAVQQGATTYVSIVAGDLHTCGRSAAGQTYCWGSNYTGQLGTGGSAAAYALPAAVQQGSVKYVDVSAGADHTCARSAPGQVYCWGSNSAGQLGDSTRHNRSTPVPLQ